MTKLNELAAKGELCTPANGHACKFETVSTYKHGTGERLIGAEINSARRLCIMQFSIRKNIRLAERNSFYFFRTTMTTPVKLIGLHFGITKELENSTLELDSHH
jgi:hypothetical protein